MNITWKQFKNLVEKKLTESGKTDETEIEYIDVNGGNFYGGGPDIHVNEHGRLTAHD